MIEPKREMTQVLRAKSAPIGLYHFTPIREAAR